MISASLSISSVDTEDRMTMENGSLERNSKVYGDSLIRMKKKINLLTNARKLYTPSSVKSFAANGHSKMATETVPPIRQKTAVLSRRNSYNGKIKEKVPLQSRYISNTRRSRNRRPRRSISDEGSISSCSSSASSVVKSCPIQPPMINNKVDENNVDLPNVYSHALYNLAHDDRWKKEIALGNRIDFYRLYRDLGKGTFSKVKVAVHYLTKEKVAVKIIEKTKLTAKARRLLTKEITVIEGLRHPNIIRLFEIIETPFKVYMTLEFADGGELFGYITAGGKIPDADAKLIFAQVASAVQYLHKQNIVHKDLKAENVFLSGPNTVKIANFGFSTQIYGLDDKLLPIGGVSSYVAPELLRKDPSSGSSVDLWALGVLLFLMVTATLPFKGDTIATIKKQILNGFFTIPKHVSAECNTLISGLLRLDPNKRMRIQQIKSSEWMKNVKWPQSITERGRENSAVEKQAKQAMSTLGIGEDILKEHESKDSRSQVNGTYRILLHKHEKILEQAHGENGKTNIIRKVASCPSFHSRACAIL